MSNRSQSDDLRRSVVESTKRELAEAKASPQVQMQKQLQDPLGFTPDRLSELNDLSGEGVYGSIQPPLENDLLGNQTHTVSLSLQQAISRTVGHNLDLQLARLDAAASQTDIVAAEAVFDWTFFADSSFQITDEPSIVAAINGVPIGSETTRNRSLNFDAGLRKPLITGGQIDITQRLDIFNNQSPGRQLLPDPARTTSLEVALSQPLLRGFGSDVALAQIRMNRNIERTTLEQLRLDLINTVTRAEQAYWSLYQTYREAQIAQQLLDRGVQTRDILKSRLAFDVRPAEYSDAVAQVESRRADLIRTLNALRQRSDELKVIINDPDLTVGGEAVLLPIDAPADSPMKLSLVDSLETAFASRPEIQQAILSIDDASIREAIADNARLPQLDLQLTGSLNGLGATTLDSYDSLFERKFVDYLMGVSFEQPLGNRAAEAGFRRARLERVRSVVAYRSAAQKVVAGVKAALRNVVTNYTLIEQTRIARLAAAENLRTLLVEEKNIRGLTAAFLDLKLRRQDALATAQRAEIQAKVDYSSAIADLYAATGSTLKRNRIHLAAPNPGD